MEKQPKTGELVRSSFDDLPRPERWEVEKGEDMLRQALFERELDVEEFFAEFRVNPNFLRDIAEVAARYLRRRPDSDPI